MGLGVTHCRLSKQKLNTKISTEAELVSTSDYFPYNIWYVIFMHRQGYLNKSTKFFQENQSAVRMEVNEENYFTENSRYLYQVFLYRGSGGQGGTKYSVLSKASYVS